MSTVNTGTIFSDFTTSNSLNVGNSTANYAFTSNSTTITVGSVNINTTSIYVSNATNNTTINTTAISTNSITINGINYTSAPASVNTLDYQTFTTTGWNTWTKPAGISGNSLVTIIAWGGGGSANTSQGQGGGGGACLVVNLLASQCNATCNVYVASGGAAGASGQTSVFWTNSTFSISAYGGGAANVNTSAGGGGVFSLGLIANGGGPLGGNSTVANSTFGGGYGKQDGASGVGVGSSVYGGGGGSRTGPGGNSIYGGGGGCNNGIVGTSVFGGSGGNNTVAATAPGGGGGGTSTNAPGARGEVRVYIQKVG